MIHYTCDRCKREIRTNEQSRYVLHMEVRAVRDDSFAHFADEVDHLNELNEMLETGDSGDVSERCDDVEQPGAFDLCPACCQQILQNPLGRETGFAIGFSNN